MRFEYCQYVTDLKNFSQGKSVPVSAYTVGILYAFR